MKMASKSFLMVILDGVFNHCSETIQIKSGGRYVSIFEDVKAKGRDSEYSDWFEWTEDNTWRGFANLSHIPIFNTENDECADYLVNVAKYWTEHAGIDGWRLDVANELGQNFIWRLNKTLTRLKPDMWLLGEILHDEQKLIDAELLGGITNHHWREMVVNYLLGRWNSKEFDCYLQTLWYRYPSTFYTGVVNYLSNHDTPRILSVLLSNYDYATSVSLNCIAAILLFTSMGTPMVYYGEEIGMEGEADPDCRKCMEWDMAKWETSKIDLRLKIRSTYKMLIALRKENPWLACGLWQTIEANDEGLYVYKRVDCLSVQLITENTKELIVIVNPRKESMKLKISADKFCHYQYKDITSGEIINHDRLNNLNVGPYSGMLLLSI